MELSTILILIVAIAVIAFIAWLLRSFLAFILLCVVVYLLFHIGFIWDFDEMNNHLKLDRIFKPEVTEQIESGYDDFKEKREKHGVIDTKEVKNVVEESVNKAWKKAGEAYESVDKKALIKEIQKQLDFLTEEEIEEAVKEAEKELQELESESS